MNTCNILTVSCTVSPKNCLIVGIGVRFHRVFKVKFNKSSVPLNAEWSCGGKMISGEV